MSKFYLIIPSDLLLWLPHGTTARGGSREISVNVPDNEEWRPGLLLKLLEKRRESLDQTHIDKPIESLCTT